MTAKRIMVISQTPPPFHGSTIMTQMLLDSLTTSGMDARLVDRRFSGSIEDVGRPSVSKAVAAVGLAFRLVWQVLAHRPDAVVFFVTNRPGSFVVDWVLSEFLRLARCKVIAYVHTIGFTELAQRGSFWRVGVARLLGAASKVVCLSESLSWDVLPWTRSRIVSIPNAVAIYQGEVDRDPPDPPLVLYLSNLIPEKGADDFVELAGMVADRLPVGAQFLIAGATSNPLFDNALHRRVAELAISDRVSFVESPREKEKWQLLAAASVLVFPTRYPFEAQPLTIIESLAVGTPVVAFGMGAIPELLDPGAGEAIAGRDLHALGDAVVQLCMDHGAWRQYSQRASQHAVLRHSAYSYARSWEATLRDVMEARR